MNKIIFNKSTFAQRLRELRKQKYSSQDSFSRAYNAEYFPASESTGGIYGTLQKYENEKNSTVPTADTLMKICQFLECDPDYLLGYHDGKTWGAQKVMEYTGLSEKAVEKLHSAVVQNNYFKLFCAGFISAAIEDSKFLPECANLIKSFLDLPAGKKQGHYVISDTDDNILYYVDLESMKETITIGLQNSIMRFIQREYIDK